MDFLKKVNRWMHCIEEIIISYGVILIAVVLIANVIARTVFLNSLKPAEEIGQLLMIMVTFIGVSYAARLGRHIQMTAIFDLVPVNIKRIILYITSIVTSVFLFLLGFLGIQYVQRVMMSGRVTPALEMPMWIMYTFVPLGFFMAGFQYLIILLLNIIETDTLYIGSEKPFDDTELPQL